MVQQAMQTHAIQTAITLLFTIVKNPDVARQN